MRWIEALDTLARGAHIRLCATPSNSRARLRVKSARFAAFWNWKPWRERVVEHPTPIDSQPQTTISHRRREVGEKKGSRDNRFAKGCRERAARSGSGAVVDRFRRDDRDGPIAVPAVAMSPRLAHKAHLAFGRATLRPPRNPGGERQVARDPKQALRSDFRDGRLLAVLDRRSSRGKRERHAEAAVVERPAAAWAHEGARASVAAGARGVRFRLRLRLRLCVPPPVALRPAQARTGLLCTSTRNVPA